MVMVSDPERETGDHADFWIVDSHSVLGDQPPLDTPTNHS